MGRLDLADQRAFAAGERVFALADSVHAVSLTGPDALALVSALTTLPPGAVPGPDGQAALALDAHGHILFGLTILPVERGSEAGQVGASRAAGADRRDGDGEADGADEADGAPEGTQPTNVTGTGAGEWLVLTDAPAEQVAEHFNARRFRRQVQARPLPGVKVVLTREPLGPLPPTAGVLAQARDWWPGAAGRPDGVGPRYSVTEPHPGRDWAGLTLSAFRADAAKPLPQRLEAAGWRQIDAAALEALRVAAWRPLATREAADGRTLPHELDWLRSTTPLGSGCYPGQEAVAKVVNVGKPPRRLVFLHLDGSEAALPEPGAAVFAVASGEPVGHVTSAAAHFELGPIALALVKRSLPTDASLAVEARGAVAANQTEIVTPSGESDARPARRAAPPPLRRRQVSHHL
ncbi:MAG: hypothetical protein LBO20_01845 [Bifidobacteriaceae bacterium]|jgi:folate-binding protein YgfZ|nr:hypothetical protein [Bifidobacteriaceae bacterium]